MMVLLVLRELLIGLQMLFVAFGALVLVPLLTGLDPCIALFTAGAGTLLFHSVTGARVPIFLASSFAFIAPIRHALQSFGVAATLGALFVTGLVYLLFAALVRKGGVGLIHRYIPPIVSGPVIMVIGLSLAPVAVKMAKSFDGSGELDQKAMLLAAVTLFTAIAVVSYGRKLLSLFPILISIAVGCALALALGAVDFAPIREAPWLAVPWVEAHRAGTFAFPTLELAAILFMIPVAIAPAIEHIGDMLAISSVAGKDFLKEPGLHRTLMGDGLATSLAGVLGGPPNTTYSEVTGAVALLKAVSPRYMITAGVAAIVLAFVSKLGAALKSIPVPVMGGIMVLLFGMIAAVGIGSLIRAQVDMSKSRNLVIAAVILVLGIGDMAVSVGGVSLSGIGLAGVAGILLNALLPREA